ncbi:hypothetical protein PPTG_23496 [Phytophthora nicotianae INRA-310]|uniref:Uncharacterized protein n=1 Tax=Phytophthora nicotianae (strain INRA-310) TaxID=761204 RepID=W2PXH7_PHYN3|nr:hypothetical protein PPTG_23496 [Phytophthora nicotianae INRA-310]ETN05316.1 hypothetical protein PPTG_23496 [Phytophthora nicotianae INRA-310]
MKKGQAVILGFGATLVGVAGALGIYLPRYSTMAQKGREQKPSSSMWKNIEKK